MSYFLNNQQRLNDLIFNGRNKEYGAYAIRSTYGSTVLKSLSIVILSFGSVMSLALYLSNRNSPEKQSILPMVQDSLVTIIYDLEKEKPAEAVAPEQPDAAPSRTESQENTVVTIVDSTAAVTATVALQQDVVNTASATTPGDGKETRQSGGDDEEVVGTKTLTQVVESYAVDSEPKFKGGLKALANYLRNNLRYPQAAADAGKGGTIYVKFVVDEQGKVSHVNLLNNLGYGMDDEARRVVSGIPDFESPGMVGGKPVKVYFQLPIRFSQH